MSKKTRIKFPENYVSGEYAVGTKCFSIVDTGRKELLGNANDDRMIAVRMYYPVSKSDVADMPRATIFTDNKKRAIMKAFHIKNVSEEMLYADFYENVKISQGRFPLIMFSMGYNSYVESNTYLLCNLASHGYIIASVGHAYEGVENDYEDGSFDVYDKNINKIMYTSMLGTMLAQSKLLKAKIGYEEAYERFEKFQNKYTPYIKGRVNEWRADIEKTLEEVKKRYAENIDFGRGIGASGHSLGGCLAYYLCRYNDEFTCGINIDGGLFGEYPDKKMERPYCQISCRENINVETRPFIDAKADTYHVIFDGMKHMGFTDAKFYIPIKMLSGKLDSDEMFRHLVYCHITFFDKYLKGADITFEGLPSDHIEYKKIK